MVFVVRGEGVSFGTNEIEAHMRGFLSFTATKVLLND